MEDADEALARARGGDPAAFEDLYRLFSAPLLGFLITQVRRREDAEDLLGEVFLAAIRDLDRFDGDASGFRAWLYRIASNRAIDHARRSIRRPEEALGDLLDLDDHGSEAIEEQAERSARRAALWKAVLALPDEQRRVIALRLSGDLTAPEIAQIVAKTPGAVKALQHRALVNLAKALGAPYPSDQPERLEIKDE